MRVLGIWYIKSCPYQIGTNIAFMVLLAFQNSKCDLKFTESHDTNYCAAENPVDFPARWK